MGYSKGGGQGAGEWGEWGKWGMWGISTASVKHHTREPRLGYYAYGCFTGFSRNKHAHALETSI